MRRWLSWQFVAPRLLMCAVTAIGVHFTAGIAIRSIAARSGAQLWGAHVDVASAHISLSDGNVLLGALSIADPICPNRTLFTAERCELEIEGTPLLSKQTIISKASMSGVKIGASEPQIGQHSRSQPATDEWFTDHNAEAAEVRLAKLGNRFDDELLSRLESVQRTKAFCESWPNSIATLDSRVAQLERNAAELEKLIDSASANQLRHNRLLDEVPARAAELRKSLDSLSNDFDKLPEQLEEERRLIVAARKQDEQFIRSTLHVESIAPEPLAAYLLREQVASSLENLITCLRGMRQVFPSQSARSNAPMRGEDVLFAGMRPTPRLLIRSLELDGELSFADQPVAFHGLISNLTTTPSLLGEPVQLRLSATDSTPFELRATIDRRGGRVRDELFVECQKISLPEHSLGHAEQLQVKLAPSTGSLTVSVTVDGDQLLGEIQLVQQQVRMTPTFAGQDRLPISESLGSSLAQLDSIATRISLNGTIEAPTCKLWSNLGPAVAEALEHGMEHFAEAHARTVLAEGRQLVDERLAELDRQVSERRERFATMTSSLPQRIDAIAQLQASRERMSSEQVGQRLPANSILR